MPARKIPVASLSAKVASKVGNTRSKIFAVAAPAAQVVIAAVGEALVAAGVAVVATAAGAALPILVAAPAVAQSALEWVEKPTPLDLRAA